MGCGDVLDPFDVKDKLEDAITDPIKELEDGDVGGAIEAGFKGPASVSDPVYIWGETFRKGAESAMTPDMPEQGPDVIGQQETFSKADRTELRRRKGLGSTRLAPPGLLTLSEENLKRPSLLGS